MKRTYADRPNWSRVIEKRFRTTYIEDEELEGYMSIIYIDKVRDPLFVGVGDETLCLADDGFIWMQYFPLERNYALTFQFNNSHDIIQLYFDICNGNKINDSGIPYYDDMYLDIVLLPSGEVMLFDEDELKQALEDNDISQKQFDSAYNESKELLDYIQVNKILLIKNSWKYLNYMLSLDV